MGRSDFAMHPGNLVVSVPTPQNKFSLQVFLPIDQFSFSYIHKPSCPFPSKVRFWWTKIKPLYIFMCPKRCSLYFQPILPGQMHGLSHSKSSKLAGCMWANAHLIWETLFKYFTHELSAPRGWGLSYVHLTKLLPAISLRSFLSFVPSIIFAYFSFKPPCLLKLDSLTHSSSAWYHQ